MHSGSSFISPLSWDIEIFLGLINLTIILCISIYIHYIKLIIKLQQMISDHCNIILSFSYWSIYRFTVLVSCRSWLYSGIIGATHLIGSSWLYSGIIRATHLIGLQCSTGLWGCGVIIIDIQYCFPYLLKKFT